MAHSTVCWVKSYLNISQTLDTITYDPFVGVLKPRSFVYTGGSYPQHATAIAAGNIEIIYRVLPEPA